MNSADLMAEAFKTKGQDERNKVQLQQLETDQLDDALAGLHFLKTVIDVDTNRIAVAGHSFGGSLCLLVAEHEPDLRAAVVFSGAGYSWDLSPQLQSRLLLAVKKIPMPVMFIHAKNDYSIHPGVALDSAFEQLKKPHLLKIYPAFGNTSLEAHNLVFLSTVTWEKDVFKFLDKNVKNFRR
jgi:dienelactone hydrolase